MTKSTVNDWDGDTAGNNTDVGGVNIDELCNPSGINNAIREVMAQVKSFFKTSLFRLRDSTDETKLADFDLSGITTSTTRTITMPDNNVDLGLVGGWQFVTSITASNDTSIDFDGSYAPASGYDYMITLRNMDNNSADANPLLRFGTGGTPTYQTTGYTNQAFLIGGTGTAAARDNITNAIELIYSGQCGGASANETWDADIIISNPGASIRHKVESRARFYNTSGLFTMSECVGARSTAEVLTGLRILLNSGNISGLASLYRRKNT